MLRSHSGCMGDYWASLRCVRRYDQNTVSEWPRYPCQSWRHLNRRCPSLFLYNCPGTGARNVCVNLARLWGGMWAKAFSSAICHSGISVLSHCGPRKSLMGMKCDFILLVTLLRWMPVSHWHMHRLWSMVWCSISAGGSVKWVGLEYFILTKCLRAGALHPALEMCLGWRCLCGLQGNRLLLIMVFKCSLMANV